MTLLRANNSGELLQILDEARRTQVEIPPDTIHELEVDDETNASLLDDLTRDIDSYRLVDGILTYNGVAVRIQPPSAIRQRLLTLRDTNQQLLDESTYQGAQPLVRQLAAKLAWLELEWRAFQRASADR